MLYDLARIGPAQAAVAAKVQELSDTDGPVLEQGIRWKPTRWRSGTLGELAAHLNAVAEVSEPYRSDERLIRRHHVVSIADTPRRFLATMIWGFGVRGYGPSRVRTIVANGGPHLLQCLNGICDAAVQGPAATWDAFTQSHKLKGLGPAFATKVAYFASCSQQRILEPRPLIADLNTSWAMWDLIGLPRSVERRDSYLAYVELAHVWAGEIGCGADDVERALFEIGKSSDRRLG